MTVHDNEADEVSQDREWPLWFQRVILPYVAESTLWPVFTVVALAFSLGIVLLVLTSFVHKSIPSMFALALTVFGSGLIIQFEKEHRKRVGALTAIVVVGWLLILTIAYFAHSYGVY